MLHLFNKTYLELDDKIELNFDRVVISNINGVNIAEFLDKSVQGKLIKYGKNLDDFNFFNLIAELESFGSLSNKKILIYCDKNNYIKFLIKWFKTILPNIDLNSFNRLVNLTVYKEITINNTQMQVVKPVKTDTLWGGLGDLTEKFNSETILDNNRNFIKNLNLKHSYEFLLADYFGNSNNFNNNYVNLLKTTVHLFLRRWLKEAFTDNREMILFNVLNKNFQTALDFTEDDLDLSSINPIKGIPSLNYYADETIWVKENNSDMLYSMCKIENLSQEKINGLRNLLKSIYSNIEGMEINRTMFSCFDYLEYACKDSITTDEMDIILNFVVQNPFDTCLVPKFDFENINYVFLHHLLNLKRDNNIEALKKFRLL
jgi:hypothetical protein